MSLRARLLVFGYPLLEITTAYLVGRWLGWVWLFVLLLAGIPAGFAIMRNAGDAAMRDMRQAQSTGQPPATASTDPGRHATVFVAGLLIAIPGLWTDLLGLLLLIPPTRRLFTRRSRRWLDGRFTAVRVPGVRYPGAEYGSGFGTGGTVIQGTVIEVEDLRGEDRPGPTAG